MSRTTWTAGTARTRATRSACTLPRRLQTGILCLLIRSQDGVESRIGIGIGCYLLRSQAAYGARRSGDSARAVRRHCRLQRCLRSLNLCPDGLIGSGLGGCVCQLDLAHFDTLIWPPCRDQRSFLTAFCSGGPGRSGALRRVFCGALGRSVGRGYRQQEIENRLPAPSLGRIEIVIERRSVRPPLCLPGKPRNAVRPIPRSSR